MLLLKIIEIPPLGFYKSLNTVENGFILCHIQSHITIFQGYARPWEYRDILNKGLQAKMGLTL